MDEFFSRYSENCRTDDPDPHLMSPPGEWPEIFKQSKELKDFLKSLKTKRVRLCTRPMAEDGLAVSKVLGFQGGHISGWDRALKIRQELGEN